MQNDLSFKKGITRASPRKQRMSSKSNYTDMKMSQSEKKLKDFRIRVNSLSSIPKSATASASGSVTGEKRRCVSESNASVNGIAGLASLHSSNHVPPIPMSPNWDLIKLAHESEFLAQCAAKEIKKSEFNKNGGLIAWIRKWSRKKQIGKVIAMFDDLLPRLKTTEEEVFLWLTALAEKKESTLLESSNMLKDMEASIGIYESYVDFYDELINDCLKISLEVSRELSDLRIAGAFNEELVPILAAENARQGYYSDLYDLMGTVQDENNILMEPSDSPTKMGSLNVEDITATDTSPIAQSQISPPHTASPPVSCPGSPTTNAKRYSPGPVPEARNAGPAVWHGIKGSNMKRHMHVNFLIDVPPAPAPVSPLGLGISSGIPNGMVLGPPLGGDIIRPPMSPSTSPSPSFLLSRSPPRSDTVNSGQISGQRADDILSAIHALQLPESRFNSDKVDMKIVKGYEKVFNFSATPLNGNNTSDIDSSGGFIMNGTGVHATRIDDELEARIVFSENNTESSDIRSFNGIKPSLNLSPIATSNADKSLENDPSLCSNNCCYANTNTIGQNNGPFGGPSFGPFGGPVFGFKAVPDRWSELGTQTQILNFTGPVKGAEYNQPVGLQFYSPLWSQMEYQMLPVIGQGQCDNVSVGEGEGDSEGMCRIKSNREKWTSCKLQCESDRWSGRWHGMGPTGTGSCIGIRKNPDGLKPPVNTVSISEANNRGREKDVAGDDIRMEKGVSLFLENVVEPCGIEENTEHSSKTDDIPPSSVVHEIISIKSTDPTENNEDIIELGKDLGNVHPNKSEISKSTNTVNAEHSMTSSKEVVKGLTYAEVVMNKKELIREIEEERKKQEITLLSPKVRTDETYVHPLSDDVTYINSEMHKSSEAGLLYGNSNSTEDICTKNSSEKAGQIIGENNNSNKVILGFPIRLQQHFDAAADMKHVEKVVELNGSGSTPTVKATVCGVKSVECSTKCCTNSDDVIVGQNSGILSEKVDGNKSNIDINNGKINGISINYNDNNSNGSSSDESEGESDEDSRIERRKSLKSNSVSLAKLNLVSPSKITTPVKNNTIMNKLNTIINHDGGGNAVNTLFSVLSLASPNSASSANSNNNNTNSYSNQSASRNATRSQINNEIIFNNENNSFTNTYDNSKSVSDNNKNYYYNNINNNYRPSNAPTPNNFSKNQSCSSGNLQKLNHNHNSKSVKRHGSLNSISNYGSTNFAGGSSPLKQKVKNSALKNGIRESMGRPGNDQALFNIEDDSLQSDDLYNQFNLKIRIFSELKDSITGLLKSMKASREAEQQHLRQVRKLWKELLAQKTDAVTIASKKKEEGSSKSIHASILSKINLNNNQKAGLSFAPRHSQKNCMDLVQGSKSPSRSRSSTQGSKDGSSGTPCPTPYSLSLPAAGGPYNNQALSPALLALSMYNYVPSLSPKNGDLAEEDISGFGSHSRFSYSLSSINNSHNNSHNSLHSLSSGNGTAVCISDKYNDTEAMLDPKDKAVSSHVVECVSDLRILVREEMLAREKLESLRALLDSTTLIGQQLQSVEIIGNKSEHSITPSPSKSNYSSKIGQISGNIKGNSTPNGNGIGASNGNSEKKIGSSKEFKSRSIGQGEDSHD